MYNCIIDMYIYIIYVHVYYIVMRIYTFIVHCSFTEISYNNHNSLFVLKIITNIKHVL